MAQIGKLFETAAVKPSWTLGNTASGILIRFTWMPLMGVVEDTRDGYERSMILAPSY